MFKFKRAALLIALYSAWFTYAWADEPLRSAKQPSKAAEVETLAEPTRPSVAEARRQAEILHSTIHATLQVVHHQYYREDEGLAIPAATLRDVFAELEREQHIKLRWLAVEGKAMNSDHKPQDAFEIEAAQALQSGRQPHEGTEDGVYRRAAAIRLTNQCLKCHVPDRKNTEDRTAGLIISIPVKEK